MLGRADQLGINAMNASINIADMVFTCQLSAVNNLGALNLGTEGAVCWIQNLDPESPGSHSEAKI